MSSNHRHLSFSLIEILIVVSILALLAAITASFLGSSLGVFKEEELKEKVIDLVQSSRLTAQLQGAKQSILFSKIDSDQWQISLSTAQENTEFTVSQEQREQALATWDPNAFNEEKNILLKKDWILLDQDKNPLNEDARFHFYPDGQSSGGRLYLQIGENGRLFSMSIDQLTSRMTWQEQK